MSASAFADWVFKIEYGDRKVRSEASNWAEERKSLGELAHRSIQLAYMNKVYLRKFGPGFNADNDGDWELLFCGDDQRFASTILFASSIVWKQSRMACKPDVVVRNRRSNKVVIIERKTTWVPKEKLDLATWHNAQVQLWCYSHVDNWRTAPSVDLVLELWRRQGTGLTFSGNIRSWARGDAEHESVCRRLFHEYTQSLS